MIHSTELWSLKFRLFWWPSYCPFPQMERCTSFYNTPAPGWCFFLNLCLGLSPLNKYFCGMFELHILSAQPFAWWSTIRWHSRKKPSWMPKRRKHFWCLNEINTVLQTLRLFLEKQHTNSLASYAWPPCYTTAAQGSAFFSKSTSLPGIFRGSVASKQATKPHPTFPSCLWQGIYTAGPSGLCSHHREQQSC